jgi:hypothetical protein
VKTSPLLPGRPRAGGAVPVLRGYNRAYDYGYEVPPAAQSSALLVPVTWDGLPLNSGYQDPADPDGALCCVVESVTGWLDSPPLDGHDGVRAVADGAAWGPKTLGPRAIAITGVALGPRELLGGYRDQLAARAAAREPAELSITDGGLGRTLTAQVRADTNALQQTWLTPTFWRYTVTLTAADPVLYEAEWQTAVLVPDIGGTGRAYKRSYTWQYASTVVPNAATVENDGNTAAPVYAIYEGDLAASTLADDYGHQILVAVLQPGEQIQVASGTLTALAPGGYTRANYVQPGSVPMLLPPESAGSWHLYTTGGGSVTLAWRAAWV